MSRQASGDRSEPRDRIRLAIAAEADERYATPGLVAAGCWLRAERSCDPRAGRLAGVGGARHALPLVFYRARPALACIIGARRAWTVEMISSEEIPCR
jgi:hypothetical protein